jgi:hypothetical protein
MVKKGIDLKHQLNFRKIAYRSFAVNEALNGTITVSVVGSEISKISSTANEIVSCDHLLLVKININILEGNVSKYDILGVSSIFDIPGNISRIVSIPDELNRVLIGSWYSSDSNFHYWVMNVSILDNFVKHSVDESTNQPFSNLNPYEAFSLPEICSHFLVVPTESINNTPLILSLSLKNRLYCGDNLIMNGASSFVFNCSFSLLMYVTIVSRPQLHFTNLSSLLDMSSRQLSSAEESNIFDCAEPRPLERGSRLIASLTGDSKVIIQLPRGIYWIFLPEYIHFDNFFIRKFGNI